MNSKNYLKILVGSILLIPMIFNAESAFGPGELGINEALIVELFLTIHVTIFLLFPLARIIKPDDTKKMLIKLFLIRCVVGLIMIIFVTTDYVEIEFYSVFIGALLLFPIALSRKRNLTPTINKLSSLNSTIASSNPEQIVVNGIELHCSKCGSILQVTDKTCSNCGEPFDGNNVVVKATPEVQEKILSPSDFDQKYSLSESMLLEKVINDNFIEAGISFQNKLVPASIVTRKKIFNLMFSLLLSVLITMVFFHFPIWSYAVGIIILVIFFKYTRGFNLKKYIIKEITSRPSEKISNIIMNVKTSLVEDSSRKILGIGTFIAIIIPLVIFMKPVIIFEKTTFNGVEGYGVRYYAFGLTNMTSVEIPESHNGKPVISLRGNTFSNMFLLREAKLPDSILEIRGQAFLNTPITKVTLPSRLEYLGGGAFAGSKIESVELPDTLTYLGGEAFLNAVELKEIKLSNSLLEIRGNTFENCISLQRIDIPDSVSRIGGHAFYGDSSLREVNIGQNSNLLEIGSSAFRRCSRLFEIVLPQKTSVNAKAFKESPTAVKRYGKIEEGTANDTQTFIMTKKLKRTIKLEDNDEVDVEVVDFNVNTSTATLLFYTNPNTKVDVKIGNQILVKLDNDERLVVKTQKKDNETFYLIAKYIK